MNYQQQRFQSPQPSTSKSNSTVDNSHINERLANDLGRLLKIPFSLSQGASILTLSNGREIWLESPSDSVFFIVHTELKKNSSSNAQEAIEYLALNSRPDILRGAYISLHRETQSIRICVSILTEMANAEIVKVLIDNMNQLADSLNQR